MTTHEKERPGIEGLLADKAGQLLFELVSHIPLPHPPPEGNPRQVSRQLIAQAAKRAGVLSATLSLPGGPLGILAMLPDLAGVWRIQAQLVADIAAAHGKTSLLTREAMVWCLFKHSTAQLLRDLAVRTGRQFLLQKLSSATLSALLYRVGFANAQRFASRAGVRLLPLAGAAACGVYAWYDTRSVGRSAQDYFAAVPKESL